MNVSDADLFGKFVPNLLNEKVETEEKLYKVDQVQEDQVLNKSKELKAEGDPLLQDNVSTDDIANLDAVQENAVNIDSTGMPPGPPGSTDTLPTLKVVDQDMTELKRKQQNTKYSSRN